MGFWQQLRKNKYVYALQLLLAVTIMVDYAIGVNINHILGNWFYVLPVAASLLVNASLFSEWRLYHTSDLVMAIYYVLTALFLVFMTPVFGPYYLLLILLIFASAYWYHWNGLIIGLLVSTGITAAAVWYQYDVVDGRLLVTVLVRLVILAIVGVMFTLVSRQQTEDEGELKLRETVSFERTRLLSLINSMADAVIATNRKGQIVLYNGAALDLLNTHVSLEEKYLQRVIELYDEHGQPIDVIGEADKADRVVKRQDLHFVNNENQDVNVYSSVSPIRSGFTAQGDAGFIVVLRDITKEKTLDEERDEFISVTSHELRTPIAIVEANLSTALLPNMATAMDPKVKSLLDQAHSNVIFLGDLVNDLTTLARAERDDLRVEVTTIEPVKIITKLVEDYQAEAKTKGLYITLSKEAAAKPVISSELYIREILQNFVTNAIKYTPKGGLTLGVKSTADGSAVFSVTDSGVGIAAADKKRVFSKFYRAEDYRTRTTRGTGLGLYITTKLAQRIKGTIWFESELNKGSVFYLQVPPIGAQRGDQAKVAREEVKGLVGSI